ncbi:MAG: hypothetical protein JXQ73_24555 [Phycisphaerae bacterium]|nr:hypothetical protein [Phycisphaerae bacterium]
MKKSRTPRGPHPLDVVLVGASLVMGLFIIGHVVQSVAWHIAFPYEGHGWVEGHFLHNALTLSRGENIYTDPSRHPVTGLPYGFLYTAVLAPLVRLFGPRLWIGRAVSTVASMLCLVWVCLTASRQAGGGKTGHIAAACGFIFACIGYFLSGKSWDATQADALYVVLGLGSLSCVDRMLDGRRTLPFALAVLLGCASCCAKQTGGGFIAAVTLSLFFRNRRLGLLYAASCAVLLAVIVAVGQLLTGGQLLGYMIMVLGDPYFPAKLVLVAKLFGLCAPLLLIAAGWQIGKDVRRSRWSDPVAWALIWVGGGSLAAYIKYAGYLNNLMPLCILLAVPAGVRAARMLSGPRTRAVALLGLAAQLGLVCFALIPEARRFDETSAAILRVAGPLIEQEVRSAVEPVWMTDRFFYAIREGLPIHDSLAILSLCGSEDFTPGRHAVEMGLLIQARIRSELDRAEFGTILIPSHEMRYLSPDLRQLLHDRYHVTRVICENAHVTNYTPMLVLRRRGDLAATSVPEPLQSGFQEPAPNPR